MKATPLASLATAALAGSTAHKAGSTSGSTSALSVEGPSFPLFVRALATLLLLALLMWGWRALADGGWEQIGRSGRVFLALVAVVVGCGWWAIVRGRTRIDGEHLRQSGLWAREVALADITQLKLVQIPTLAWCFVPRLVVRSRRVIGLTTFSAGTPELLAAFRRLAYGER